MPHNGNAHHSFFLHYLCISHISRFKPKGFVCLKPMEGHTTASEYLFAANHPSLALADASPPIRNRLLCPQRHLGISDYKRAKEQRVCAPMSPHKNTQVGISLIITFKQMNRRLCWFCRAAEFSGASETLQSDASFVSLYFQVSEAPFGAWCEKSRKGNRWEQAVINDNKSASFSLLLFILEYEPCLHWACGVRGGLICAMISCKE